MDFLKTLYFTSILLAAACIQREYTPTERPNLFQDNENGTIEDNRTKILWQKCSMGQKENSTCDGASTETNWLSAMQYCKNLKLANKHWDLPTSKELIDLISSGYLMKKMILFSRTKQETIIGLQLHTKR